MFQPRAKLEFIRRYLPPGEGWEVFVDIDASEEGRTGGVRTSSEARVRQQAMERDAKEVRKGLAQLSVRVGGSRKKWFREFGFARIRGDHDIVAFHSGRRVYAVAEVEGESAGQPEQKLYKAVGQIVMAASDPPLEGWQRELYIVVYGERIARHLSQADALGRLGIGAVSLSEGGRRGDSWLTFGPVAAVGAVR